MNFAHYDPSVILNSLIEAFLPYFSIFIILNYMCGVCACERSAWGGQEFPVAGAAGARGLAAVLLGVKLCLMTDGLF